MPARKKPADTADVIDASADAIENVPADAPADTVDEFAALLETATMESRRAGAAPKKTYLEESSIPADYFRIVEELHTSQKRLRLKVTTGEQFKKLGRLFRSAAHHRGLSATFKGVFDGEGDDATLIGGSLTVSDKRGSKNADNVDTENDGE